MSHCSILETKVGNDNLCGKPLWVVSKDLERDVFMSATEAQTHGIVDLVAVQ